MVDFVPSF